MKNNLWKSGVEEIISSDSLQKRLKTGKKLRIKYGVDPTRPDIHLGHAVAMWKLKELQEMGHTVIFLIGDYTTKIGDPSGRNTTRPVLSDEEIKCNAKTYFDQVSKILDLKKTEVRYNSEWFKNMTFSDILSLAGKFTVASIIERDDFSKRIKDRVEVGLHELLYPLMQAYDSVALNADIEFGGSDQKFNILAGRELQKKIGQIPQEIVLFKLLVGTDGKKKMSKSEGNYIGITEPAPIMFGKIMSIPDSLILTYFELCALYDEKNIKKIDDELKSGKNPRDIKEKLALEIVKLYHGEEESKKAAASFSAQFREKKMPDKMPEIKLTGNYELPLLIVEIGAANSNSEARRLIQQGAIRVDGAKISDPKSTISAYKGMVIQVGKLKYWRIK
ncbi:MAG: tyrosine--tRNA ligase [Patescibacteria group bacterium]